MFRRIIVLGGAVGLALTPGTTAWGQIPGAPVLQNAFGNPGLAAAANFGAGGGQSLFALAGGWGLGSGRIQVSGAAGAQRSNDATRGAYGAKAAFTAWTSGGGSLGVSAFGGVGGAPRTRSDAVMTNPAILTIPAGLSVGYRRGLGATRGISAYVSPMYRWARVTADDGVGGEASVSEGTFRVSAGLDISLTPSLGATVGSEFGSGGNGGSNFGAAVTWLPGRR